MPERPDRLRFVPSDPRSFDLRVRTLTTAAIALVITLVAAYSALDTGSIPTELAGWGALVIGFYFGSHSSMNGAGARARQDQEITKAIAEPATGVVVKLDTPNDDGDHA